jgi:hypothetical protein
VLVPASVLDTMAPGDISGFASLSRSFGMREKTSSNTRIHPDCTGWYDPQAPPSPGEQVISCSDFSDKFPPRNQLNTTADLHLNCTVLLNGFKIQEGRASDFNPLLDGDVHLRGAEISIPG